MQARLQQEGLVLLRNFLPVDLLTPVREAARRCFASIAGMECIPERYRFIPQAHSLLLASLLDFGIEGEEALTAPLSAAVLGDLLTDMVGPGWRCRLEHCWARKKFAPRNAPPSRYHIQDWHQDGALGVQFPIVPGTPIPPVTMATCWIPLDPCGTDSPGLEFILQPQPALLHFTELDDALLRRRFAPEAFWAPELEFGDMLVFRGDLLHRTHSTVEMRSDRISVEYRVFPD